MKQRALKTAILAVEVAAIVLAFAAALASLLIWRLGQGPVPLTVFRPSAEASIERSFPKGYHASVAGIELRRGATRGDYILAVSDIEVRDERGGMAAAAPEVRVAVNVGDLIARKIGPKSIEAAGARFHITRHRDRKIDVPAARKLSSRDKGEGLAAQIEARLVKSAFQYAAFDDVEIDFLDEASGRSWSTKDATLRIEQTAEGLTAHTRGAIDMDGVRSGVEASGRYDKAEGLIRVIIDGENFPAGDILSTFYGDSAAILDAPVSGRAVIAITPDGEVRSSEFNARIGEGKLAVGGGERRISNIEWLTSFDPASNRFSVDHFTFDVEGASGVISGAIAVTFGEDVRNPQMISFDLASDEIVIDAGERLPAVLPISGISVSGGYDVEQRQLALRSFSATASGLTTSGNITVNRPAKEERSLSPGIVADLDFTGDLDPQRLLSLWPRGLAAGARDWAEERLEKATISNIDATVNLAPGAIREGEGLPDDGLMLSFDARDAVAHYVMGMTPLRNGSGKGVVRGNSFLLTVDAATVGAVKIAKGEVAFPVFMPKWEPTYYRFTAVGDAQDMLGILDQAPLSLLSKVNLEPSQFSGPATADVEIMRPNKRDVLPEEYGYKGVARFHDMSLRDIVGDMQITNAKGRVDLSTRSFTVTADASLADDAPVKISWKQNFYRPDGPSHLSVSGVFSSSAGDLFGLPSRQLVRGPVAFEAEATGDLGDFETLSLKTDFTEAALTASAFGWRKAAGLQASGALDMRFSKDLISVNGLSIKGEGVDIAGDLSFTREGVLQSAEMKRFYLQDGADLSLSAKRDASGRARVTVVGPRPNIGDFIAQTLENESGAEGGIQWGKGVNVNAHRPARDAAWR
ncbi:MAG: DUF3971 domain-containing protein [Parvularculaceae bacterium]